MATKIEKKNENCFHTMRVFVRTMNALVVYVRLKKYVSLYTNLFIAHYYVNNCMEFESILIPYTSRL